MHQHLAHYEGHALFLTVAVFLAIYLLLTFFNPEFVQREDKHGEKNGVNDQAVTMLYALGILFLIALALALLWYAFHCAW